MRKVWIRLLVALGFIPEGPIPRTQWTSAMFVRRPTGIRKALFSFFSRLARFEGVTLWGDVAHLFPNGSIILVLKGGADTMTVAGALSTDQVAYDQAMRWGLRPQLYYDAWIDEGQIRPSDVSTPGATVVLTTNNDLAAQTTPLSESVDVDAVALSDTQNSYTMQEFGNAVITSALIRATSWADVDLQAAQAIGYNAGLSVDTIARAVFQAGSNVRYAGGVAGRTSLGTGNVLTAALVRRTRAEMVGANVQLFGNYGAAAIHPDVSYDFRGETGAAAWRDPHVYSQPAEIWSGEVGVFEGFRFREFSRAPLFADASNGGGGAGTIDVYGTLFFGREAFVKIHNRKEGNGPDPRIILSPVTDKLRRFVALGWYWLGNYGRYRESALRRVESASTIGANT